MAAMAITETVKKLATITTCGSLGQVPTFSRTLATIWRWYSHTREVIHVYIQWAGNSIVGSRNFPMAIGREIVLMTKQ